MNTESPLPPIVETIDIEAPIDAVWRAMTAEESVSTWLGCMNYKKQLGHVFFMQPDEAKRAKGDTTGATQCEVLALDANERLRFSWFVPGFPATTVTFRLEALDAHRTRVLFEHAGWERFPAAAIAPIREALKNGWRGFVLPGLKKAAEAA
jgi:uncharacterized protein YndB with AHSA1/START domain